MLWYNKIWTDCVDTCLLSNKKSFIYSEEFMCCFKNNMTPIFKLIPVHVYHIKHTKQLFNENKNTYIFKVWVFICDISYILNFSNFRPKRDCRSVFSVMDVNKNANIQNLAFNVKGYATANRRCATIKMGARL